MIFGGRSNGKTIAIRKALNEHKIYTVRLRYGREFISLSIAAQNIKSAVETAKCVASRRFDIEPNMLDLVYTIEE